MKDSNFYNAESTVYSAKRYPNVTLTFGQYFFKSRLRLTLALLKEFLPHNENIHMLEIGCADGVVTRALWEAFPGRFEQFDALDTAPGMVAMAQAQNADIPVRFSLREGNVLHDRYQTVVEIGVLNYTEFGRELDTVRAALDMEGVYICSVSGRSSLYSAFKGAEGFLHWHEYQKYEDELRKRFTIVKTVPVGFFLPLLWKIPTLARHIQPLFEVAGSVVLPNWAHEKIYVLKLNDR